MTTYQYQIQAFQVDFQRKATMTTIGNYLLQTAGQDADQRGFGLGYMLPNNRAWVLARFSIKMNKYPGPQEIINIQTWIHDIGALLTTRKFNILDEKEKKIGEASSSWVAMDLKSRRPLRLSSFLKQDHIVNNTSHKLPPPSKLTPSPPYGQIKNLKVVYSDLDLNRHVYSIRYVQWLLDALSVDELSQKEIQQLDINYLAEAFFGDQIKIHWKNKSDKSSFLIENSTTGKDIVLAHLIWKNKEV